jgi:glycerol uptake facilitator-like aquaporin
MNTIVRLPARWLLEPRPRVASKMLAEFIACMIFHFIGSVSPTPWSNGISLIVLVYYTAKTSGAHLNPAISLAFCVLGYTNPLELLCYWVSQVLGCITGALWIACLVPSLSIGTNITRIGDGPFVDGCFVPRSDLSRAEVFGWEASATFCFMAPIFSVVWYTLNKKGYGNTGPIIIGLSLLASALAVGPFTGAALNPARVVASPSVFKCPNVDTLWCYVLGELIAGIIVPLAIMPWYGISPNAWYRDWIPEQVRSRLKSFEMVQEVQDETETVP